MSQPTYPQGYPQGQAPPGTLDAAYAQQQYQQAPPQQGYVPQQQYAAQYPQGYVPQQQQGQPPVELVKGSVQDFLDQPNVGWGPAWSMAAEVPVGTQYVGIVARDINDGDIEQQTAPNGGPALKFKDGRAKFVMKVPLYVQATHNFPDGRALMYVAGATATELHRAMSEVHAPAGPPEKGAIIKLTKINQRRNNFGTMSAIPGIEYTRPEGAAPVPAEQQAQTEAPPPVVPAAPPAPAQPAQQVEQPPAQQMAPPAQQVAPPAQVQQPAPPPVQPPADAPADPEKAALLARLTAAAGQK